MANITQQAMDFLAGLAGYGEHGLLVADTGNMPSELVALRNSKFVSVVSYRDFEPMANGKITITSIGRKALESIEALPLFNPTRMEQNNA